MTDHSGLVASGWLKKGMLEKHGKSAMGGIHFKRRNFILTSKELLYFDGPDLRNCSLKGKIALTIVRAVENLDGDAFGKKFMFQVVADEETLYLNADTRASRDEWVEALRGACKQPQNASAKHEHYHPAPLSKSTWLCCQQKGRSVPGCWLTHIFQKDEVREPVMLKPKEINDQTSLSYVDLDNGSSSDPDEESNARLGSEDEDGEDDAPPRPLRTSSSGVAVTQKNGPRA